MAVARLRHRHPGRDAGHDRQQPPEEEVRWLLIGITLSSFLLLSVIELDLSCSHSAHRSYS